MNLKDSNYDEEWVKRMWAKYPCVKLQNGDIRTGPVRGSFVNLLKPSKPTQQRPDGQYGMVLLFPAGVDLSVLINERNAVASAKWPQGGKLFNPIRDQDLDGRNMPGEADRYAGYVKGAMRIGANCNQKIVPVDTQLRPIIDETDIYSGAWYIVTVRCYTFENQGNKGPTFGLQNVMKFADDINIGGTAAAKPSEAFAGISIEPGDINADAAFGGQAAGAAQDMFS